MWLWWMTCVRLCVDVISTCPLSEWVSVSVCLCVSSLPLGPCPSLTKRSLLCPLARPPLPPPCTGKRYVCPAHARTHAHLRTCAHLQNLLFSPHFLLSLFCVASTCLVCMCASRFVCLCVLAFCFLALTLTLTDRLVPVVCTHTLLRHLPDVGYVPDELLRLCVRPNELFSPF